MLHQLLVVLGAIPLRTFKNLHNEHLCILVKSIRYFELYFILRKCWRLPAKLQWAAGDVYRAIELPVSCKSIVNVPVIVLSVNDKLLFGL